jgi:hypothetical protein
VGGADAGGVSEGKGAGESALTLIIL